KRWQPIPPRQNSSLLHHGRHGRTWQQDGRTHAPCSLRWRRKKSKIRNPTNLSPGAGAARGRGIGEPGQGEGGENQVTDATAANIKPKDHCLWQVEEALKAGGAAAAGSGGSSG
ncbi:unnamed protein product, partial [Phaeothamnion confervicola]